jgi:hypothetical protein
MCLSSFPQPDLHEQAKGLSSKIRIRSYQITLLYDTLRLFMKFRIKPKFLVLA